MNMGKVGERGGMKVNFGSNHSNAGEEEVGGWEGGASFKAVTRVEVTVRKLRLR